MAKAMSDLELTVMNIVWQRESVTVRDIYAELSKQRKIAYTTVQTLLHRLYEKELVNKNENGKAMQYSAKITKEFYCDNVAKMFIDKFVGSFGEDAVEAFVHSLSTLPEDKRNKMLKLVKSI